MVCILCDRESKSQWMNGMGCGAAVFTAAFSMGKNEAKIRKMDSVVATLKSWP